METYLYTLCRNVFLNVLKHGEAMTPLNETFQHKWKKRCSIKAIFRPAKASSIYQTCKGAGVMGAARGREVPFSKKLSRMSATSEIFDLLSLCKCLPPLAIDGIRGSFNFKTK